MNALTKKLVEKEIQGVKIQVATFPGCVVDYRPNTHSFIPRKFTKYQKEAFLGGYVAIITSGILTIRSTGKIGRLNPDIGEVNSISPDRGQYLTLVVGNGPENWLLQILGEAIREEEPFTTALEVEGAEGAQIGVPIAYMGGRLVDVGIQDFGTATEAPVFNRRPRRVPWSQGRGLFTR